jgi:hypothetical protein
VSACVSACVSERAKSVVSWCVSAQVCNVSISSVPRLSGKEGGRLSVCFVYSLIGLFEFDCSSASASESE